MKIQLISDLHLESHAYTLKVNPAADIVVIAGDFGPWVTCESRINILLKQLKGAPAVVVLGNHDYYKSTLEATRGFWYRLIKQFPNVHLLNNDSAKFQDVTFVGGTLWSNFTLFEPDIPQDLAMRNALMGITDFRVIYHEKSGNRLMPADLLDMHEACCEAIANVVDKGGKTVVVTHFMPSAKTIDPYWVQNGRPLNPYFCSPCEYLMTDNVAAWLFGHTHSSADVMIGKTRVVCNPRGYTHAENRKFDSQLIIEV